ncbi:MAG: hypothetical protein J6R10_02285 [Tidjanibacter sp.]|nr:hypothetical protein [Tidjanibacter sp.]
MKRIFSVIVAVGAMLLMVESAEAQLRTSYFMNGSTDRYNLNPALSPQRGYIAIPVAGGLYTSLESNFLSVDNFFYPNGEGNGVVTYMHKSVSAEEFLSKLPDQNYFELGLNDQIFAMGNYFKGGFWSLGVRLRSETTIDVPKDFFALTKTLSQGIYDISGMGIESSNFVEAALGYTFPVQDVFTLGFRAKLLLGLAHMSAKIDKLNVDIGSESYRADMAGSFEANIAGYNFDQMTGEITMDKFVGHLTDFSNFDPSNIKSIGFAFDAGIEWTFRDEQIRLSAAVNDLGFNAWNANNSFCATIDNITFAFNGYDLQTNEVKFESPENIALRTTSDVADGKRALHSSIVVGLEYNFLGDLIGLGALWNTKMYDSRKWNSIGAAVTFRPTTWLSAALNYSYINKLGVFGTALNIHSSLCNIFVGADYIATKYGTAGGGAIPIPLNQNSFNLSFGVAIPLGARMF